MTHPDFDALGRDRLGPDVVVHLDRCWECRAARLAWRDEPDGTPYDRTLDVAGDPDGHRYTIVRELGRGGMGDVYLGRDERLVRDVAIKVLRTGRDDPEGLVREAQLTAGLQHPSIVPIHSVGRLTDGRPFYVMKCVDGETLRARLGADLPRRRGVELVARVCEAVAFAHDAGVIHGDVKPENVLIGTFDQLTLLDFGLAVRVGSADRLRAGTPPYMAPELARGAPASLGSDGYALGAVLYEVLTGRPRFTGPPREVLRVVASNPPALVPSEVPPPLARLCARALSADAAERPTAGELAQGLRRWLDGERRTDEARERLASAQDTRRRAAEARALAATLRRLAEEHLAHVPPWASIEAKREPWRQLEQAREAEDTAHEADLDLVQALHAALELDPELPEAREELAAYHQGALVEAERRGDRREVRRSRRILEADASTAAWLVAPARVEIRSAPAGAEVVAFEPVIEDRQWRHGAGRVLGTTPLVAALPPGRWRIEVRSPGLETAVLPVRLARGGVLEADLRLPAPVEGARWVPPGWFTAGGDEETVDSLSLRRVWVDGFHLQVHPVTVAEYVRFLNDVPEAEALRHQPLETAGFGIAPRPVLVRTEGRFLPRTYPRPDADWAPDWPVLFVDHPAACVYAAWWSGVTGRRWRLPHDLEWEKAARGDDGRAFPWGPTLDPSFTNMQKSQQSVQRPCGVEDFPLDASPYGIRGLGGNVRDWCCNGYRREGDVPDGGTLRVSDGVPDAPYLMIRGGSWTSVESWCRPAARFASLTDSRNTSVGIRLACEA